MDGVQMLVGLLVGIALLLFLVLRTKVHPFLALIIAAVVIGLLGGMDPADIPASITSGFGSTLGSIGIIIGFGVMLGEIFDKTGAAERMALTFIRLFGKGREHWAMAFTGFLVSICIFCDSGFVVLCPIAKAISKKTRRSIVSIAGPLAVGLLFTHCLVPPTPGPLGVAGTFGVDVGEFMLLGLLLAVPMTIAATLYHQWLGRRIYQLPGEGEETWVRPAVQERAEADDLLTPSRPLPSAAASFLPLLAPIGLILAGNLSTYLLPAGSVLRVALSFLGAPVIAVGVGLLLAIFLLARDLDRETAVAQMEEGLHTAGVIILVTGGGGALGQLLRDSGIGDYMAQLLAQTSVPVILLPFLVASLFRVIQGSGTVAMITAAGICAPIVQAAGGNVTLSALACCVGAVFFSHFNDSYFWVFNNLIGIHNTGEQIKCESIPCLVGWGVGLIELLILSLFWH